MLFRSRIAGLLYSPGTGLWSVDRTGEGPYTQAQLLTKAQNGTLRLTVTAVMPGSGTRVALDRDLDDGRRAAAEAVAVEGLAMRDAEVAEFQRACEQLVEKAIEAAEQTFGSIDVLVNNAGITRDATMRTMTEEQFDQVIAVHLKGCWNGTRLAAARMREQKSGSIINISSLSEIGRAHV